MSYIYKIGIDKNIALFENDRFLLPGLSFRGIKKIRISEKEYISGIAVGIRFWRTGWYITIIKTVNIEAIENKIEGFENINPAIISLAKTAYNESLLNILKKVDLSK